MSSDKNWDVERYREEYESDEHWGLRKAFMVRWKSDYDEDRLVCLARVFANIELMGCRYPAEVMKEVSLRSEEIAKHYREKRKGALKRTFVSASDAAEDRAKGVKREAGVVLDATPNKSARISFVPQGFTAPAAVEDKSDKKEESGQKEEETIENESKSIAHTDSEEYRTKDIDNYFEEMSQINIMDVRSFRESMFFTPFGKFVLVVRPWSRKFENINASCIACRLNTSTTYENNMCRLFINEKLVAEAAGFSKAEARTMVEDMAWKRLKSSAIILLVKQKWVSRGARITGGDLGQQAASEFGRPVNSSVADKMMKMMGWKGGGLGAGAQGIEEPIKPHLQMVDRAGLGSSSDLRTFERSISTLLQDYQRSPDDAELVLSAEFSREERAAAHKVARKHRLATKSYGKDQDRFLVVSKPKKDPFTLVQEVVAQGGDMEKHQVLIPSSLAR